MAINQSSYSEAEVSGVFQTAQASINLTPEMFQLLSAGIYEDRILAVIRELSCNGRDAMIERAQKLSIDVSELPLMQVDVPTVFSPSFAIRDYGTGLSQEEVFEVFMCFGKSTKTSTNALIGMFGIGAKSPLAYTDSFNLISFLDGEESHYTVFMDKGIPMVTRLFSKPTEELNGLKVEVAVRDSDCNAFFSKIEHFYSLFNFPVKFNRVEVELKVEYTHKCEDYMIVKNYLEGVYALMGGVPYTVPHEVAKELRKTIKSNTVILPFNIGELSIAPSRENLSFVAGDATDLTLRNRVQKISEDYIRNVNDVISKCTNWADAFLTVNDYGFNYWTYSATPFQWKGISLHNFEKHYNSVVEGISESYGEVYVKNRQSKRAKKVTGNLLHSVRPYMRCFQRGEKFDDKFVILEKDIPRGIVKLIDSIVEEGYRVIIKPSDEILEVLKGTFGEDRLLFWKASEVLSKYKDEVGTSTTPKKPSVKISGVWVYTALDGTVGVDSLEEGEKGLYVSLVRDKVVFEVEGKGEILVELDLVKELVNNGLYEKVYFIRKTASKKFRNNGLEPLTYEMIKSKLSGIFNKKVRKLELLQKVYKGGYLSILSSPMLIDIKEKLLSIKDYPTLKFYTNKANVDKIFEPNKLLNLKKLAVRFKLDVNSVSPVQIDRVRGRFFKELEDFKQKYDFLLAAASSTYFNENSIIKLKKLALLIAEDKINFEEV